MRWVWVFLAVSGAMVAHLGQTLSDKERHGSVDVERFGAVPSGEALQWASVGFELHLSDWNWIRSVLLFGEYSEDEPDEEFREWMERTIALSVELDPDWRTLYSYGSLMLKVSGDIQASNRVLERGLLQFPGDHYLAFSIGANHYLYGEQASDFRFQAASRTILHSGFPAAWDWLVFPLSQGLRDRERVLLAAMWLRHAASLEGAPEWYSGAAASFVVKQNEREVAIRFLSEELANETDPGLVASLTSQLNFQMHALHSERLTDLAEEFSSRAGKALQAVDELLAVGLLRKVPADPYSSGWVVDVDGVVRSSKAAEKLTQQALKYERSILGHGL